jgi:hypothetical protein
MKKTLLILSFVLLSASIFAQETRDYIDTTFTTSFFNTCDEKVRIPNYIANYLINEPSEMAIKIKYKGSCSVGKVYYGCIIIHEVTLTVRLYKSNNYKIKRNETD